MMDTVKALEILRTVSGHENDTEEDLQRLVKNRSFQKTPDQWEFHEWPSKGDMI
jgi:hypothetical protein